MVRQRPTHPRTELSLYADDALVKAFDRKPRLEAEKLQENLDLLADFYKKGRLKANPSKSNVTYVTFKKHLNVDPIYYKDVTISGTKQVMYLGQVFSCTAESNSGDGKEGPFY